jgi:periplasmic divalent cation tolerance protein
LQNKDDVNPVLQRKQDDKTFLYPSLFIEAGETLETPYIIVLVTTANKQEAENITQALLEAKLIACANVIGPLTSHFRWEGKIDNAEEFLVLMKSRQNLFAELSKMVKSLHSYEAPEVLALPVVAGSKLYFDWLGDSLK